MTTPGAIAQEKESPNTLRLERVFRAPPSTVFRAWTDPGELAKWWGPDGYETTVDALDVRPGGRYRTGMTGPDGTQLWVGGVIKEVTENERLVFTSAWEEDGVPGHETQVTLTLRDRGGGTEMLLVHEFFTDRESCNNHEHGWSSSLTCLEKIL